MNHKFQSQWGSNSNSNFIFYKKECGFSWPHRNFTCNFCKKVYRSAQALGGHMNVHRRDKARLGLSLPPNLILNNYISSSSSSPPPSQLVHYLPYHSPLVSTTNAKDEHQKLKEGEEERNGTMVLKKYEVFNMGLIKDGNMELDLELRLGRSL